MHIARIEELTWQSNESNLRVPEKMRKGARRAWAARGQEGFYAHVGDMEPNFRVDSHSHPAGELIVILQGSMSFDGVQGTLGVGDVAVIPADEVYGFTAGPEGLRILNIRRAEVLVEMARNKAAAGRSAGGSSESQPGN